jgi:hypothetical protein
MGADPQVPLAHRLERRHLLDVVRVEVLKLEPVFQEDSLDEPPGGDGEAALMETTYPLGGRGTDSFPGTFHSTAPVRGGSYPASTRQRNIERDTLDHVQFDMAAANFLTKLRRKL